MDMAEFKKIWDAHDGWNKCMGIIFDNGARWFFDEVNLHKVYEEEKDKNGNVVNKRRIFNSPKAGLKEDGTKDWKTVKEQMTINESLGTLERKTYFAGVTPDEILDDDHTPNYAIEVRHVENVQLMLFMDDGNVKAHPEYPVSMT